MSLTKRSVPIELRLRAEAEARKEAAQKLKLMMIRFATGTLTLITLLALVAFDVLAVAEPVIEEVHGAGQLEKLLQDQDFVAVFWSARNCRYVNTNNVYLSYCTVGPNSLKSALWNLT